MDDIAEPVGLTFYGPDRFVRPNQFIDLKTKSITAATMEIGDRIYILRTNKIQIYPGPNNDTLYVYHFYKYEDNNEIKVDARANIIVPKADFKKDFRFIANENHIEFIENKIRIQFTDAAFKKITKMFLID